MFDDYEFIMEALADELHVTTEFVSNAQARMLGNQSNQRQNIKRPIPPQKPVQTNTNQNVFNKLLSGIRPPQNNTAANQTAKPTTSPQATPPKQVEPVSSSTPAPKAQPTPSTNTSDTSKRKPMVYGSPEYNKTAKDFGIKDDSQKSTAELQSESKARMGRINDLVSQLHNKTAMQKKVEASQAHYNAVTNNGTQSVPAGSKPSTTWSNNGDANAAKTAGTAQHNEIFKTQTSSTNTPTQNNPPATKDK